MCVNNNNFNYNFIIYSDKNMRPLPILKVYAINLSRIRPCSAIVRCLP